MIEAEEASVRADDAGLQHGVGLFETMLARHGRIFRREAHLDRMASSAAALGLALPERSVLQSALEQAVRANALENARVRLTVTPGSIRMLQPEHRPTAGPTILATATAPTLYDPAYYERGVRVVIAGPLANPFDPMQGHKTLAYWGRLRTLRDAAMAGAAEALWLSVTNHVMSGSVSNLLIVKDGVVRTPYARGEEVDGALPAPVLAGVTRAAVLELAEAAGIPTQRKMISVADLLDADEVMLTNSGWGVLAVTSVEKKAIGDGGVGPLTRRLHESYEAKVEAETAGNAAG